jgi:hypothetical protein
MDRDPYWCASCAFQANGLVDWNAHYQSSQHQNTIRLHGFAAVRQPTPKLPPGHRPKWLPAAISRNLDDNNHHKLSITNIETNKTSHCSPRLSIITNNLQNNNHLTPQLEIKDSIDYTWNSFSNSPIVHSLISKQTSVSSQDHELIALSDCCKTKAGSLHIQQLLDVDNSIRVMLEQCISGRILEWAKDRFANYVLQKMLRVMPEFRQSAIKELHGCCIKLSKNSVSSRVVELLLEFSETRSVVIEEICSGPSESMLVDRSGNFVLQKAFQFADPKELKLLQSVWKERLIKVKNPTARKKWIELCEVDISSFTNVSNYSQDTWSSSLGITSV